MDRWKDFRGREETFSWMGGKIFAAKRKHFHG